MMYINKAKKYFFFFSKKGRKGQNQEQLSSCCDSARSLRLRYAQRETTHRLVSAASEDGERRLWKKKSTLKEDSARTIDALIEYGQISFHQPCMCVPAQTRYYPVRSCYHVLLEPPANGLGMRRGRYMNGMKANLSCSP